jgi:hypothetical protein
MTFVAVVVEYPWQSVVREIREIRAIRVVTCLVTPSFYTACIRRSRRSLERHRSPKLAASREFPMTRFGGSTALRLDFGGVTTTGTVAGRGRAGLRLANAGRVLKGPDKYRILEHRRRQAQIKARHLLNIMEEAQ